QEGTDSFIQDERHLATYAAYFGRFVDAYAALGIDISMVMPQNEFNSAQPYPSCTWTPTGLAAFLRHLGPQMRSRGVEVFLGTVERPNESLVADVLADPEPPPRSPASASSGTANPSCRSWPATTPSCGSTRPNRNAATAGTTGATPATPGA
ncbi:hypothetical protein JS562_54595, partial [Agrobacterium sp. S2]|nr:hypothetical protein [Agrobacterium sp. S2]